MWFSLCKQAWRIEMQDRYQSPNTQVLIGQLNCKTNAQMAAGMDLVKEAGWDLSTSTTAQVPSSKAPFSTQSILFPLIPFPPIAPYIMWLRATRKMEQDRTFIYLVLSLGLSIHVLRTKL
ncbi:UNVERIFIED_CONTAM: hypothetical protein K2H54_048005 [Gekko kuhli]